MAMVSSTPAGSGLPIGLMPGALPSDHASRHTLNTTAMRLLVGHSRLGGLIAVSALGAPVKISALLPAVPAAGPAPQRAREEVIRHRSRSMRWRYRPARRDRRETWQC